MAANYTLKITPEQAQEMAMVDLAFLILKEANNPFYYRDLMNEVAKQKGIPEEKIQDVIAQLYTEINIDGRFACIGNNTWGLKRWYPIDKMDESVGTPDRPRIINDDEDDEDDELVELEDELEEVFEDEDLVDEDDEILDDDLDDDEEVFDDEELDADNEIEEDEDDL